MTPDPGRPKKRFSFPKTSRLLKRRQFLNMADRAAKPDLKINAGSFLVIGRRNDLSFSRLGVTVTKKVGSAVVRNRIKRQVRDLFRLNCHKWPTGLDFLFIAKQSAGSLVKAGLRFDLGLADKKITVWSANLQKQTEPKDNDRPAPGNNSFSALSAEKNLIASTKDENILSAVIMIPQRLALGLIFLYQHLISPLLPPACRFWPTCSNYAILAIKSHGLARGSYLTAWRLLKCHPFHPGGYDPVPSKKE